VGENDAVVPKATDVLTLDEIEDLLAAGEARRVEVGDGSGRRLPFTHLEHGLQTAALLRRRRPEDAALAVAGLVHDIGHLLPGVDDARHAAAGAAAVRGALGERVAGLVGMHVEAKRYLAGGEGGYGVSLSDDSVASMVRQGGAMGADERAAFHGLPWAGDALVLRRADDAGKVAGLVVAGLEAWRPVLQEVARLAG
jgi:predicted HD phosphohydrolase